jgi:hypothetical protein
MTFRTTLFPIARTLAKKGKDKDGKDVYRKQQVLFVHSDEGKPDGAGLFSDPAPILVYLDQAFARGLTAGKPIVGGITISTYEGNQTVRAEYLIINGTRVELTQDVIIPDRFDAAAEAAFDQDVFPAPPSASNKK